MVCFGCRRATTNYSCIKRYQSLDCFFHRVSVRFGVRALILRACVRASVPPSVRACMGHDNVFFSGCRRMKPPPRPTNQRLHRRGRRRSRVPRGQKKTRPFMPRPTPMGRATRIRRKHPRRRRKGWHYGVWGGTERGEGPKFCVQPIYAEYIRAFSTLPPPIIGRFYVSHVSEMGSAHTAACQPRRF